MSTLRDAYTVEQFSAASELEQFVQGLPPGPLGFKFNSYHVEFLELYGMIVTPDAQVVQNPEEPAQVTSVLFDIVNHSLIVGLGGKRYVSFRGDRPVGAENAIIEFNGGASWAGR